MGGKIRTLIITAHRMCISTMLPLKKRHLISTINFYNAYSIIIHCKLLLRFGKSAGHLSLPKINIQSRIKKHCRIGHTCIWNGVDSVFEPFFNWIKRIKSPSLNIRVTTLRLSQADLSLWFNWAWGKSGT